MCSAEFSHHWSPVAEEWTFLALFHQAYAGCLLRINWSGWRTRAKKPFRRLWCRIPGKRGWYLNQVGISRCWLNSRHILKVELTEYVYKVKRQRETSKTNLRFWAWATGKMEMSLIELTKTMRGDFIWSTVNLRYSLHTIMKTPRRQTPYQSSQIWTPSIPTTTPGGREYSCPILQGEIEIQGGWVTCPRSN